jgi:hypothetical protein
MDVVKLVAKKKDWDLVIIYTKSAPPLCVDKDTEITCEGKLLVVVDPEAPNPAKITATDPDRAHVVKHLNTDDISCIDYIKLSDSKILTQKKLIIT